MTSETVQNSSSKCFEQPDVSGLRTCVIFFVHSISIQVQELALTVLAKSKTLEDS